MRSWEKNVAGCLCEGLSPETQESICDCNLSLHHLLCVRKFSLFIGNMATGPSQKVPWHVWA